MIFEHLHPKLVHFPIALVLAAWLFDGLSLITKKEALHKAARYMIDLAALSALAASITGWMEVQKIHLAHPILSSHRTCALALTVGLLQIIE